MADMSIRVEIDLGGGRGFKHERTWLVEPKDDKLRPYMAQHELLKASRAYVAWYEKEYSIDD